VILFPSDFTNRQCRVFAPTDALRKCQVQPCIRANVPLEKYIFVFERDQYAMSLHEGIVRQLLSLVRAAVHLSTSTFEEFTATSDEQCVASEHTPGGLHPRYLLHNSK